LIVSWDERFFDPIIVPDREPLVTLCDAAEYIAELPKAEHNADEWQAAMQELLLVAEDDGATDVCAHRCHTGQSTRHVARAIDPPGKDKHWDGERLTGPSPTCVGDRTDKLKRLGFNSG
jgi:hypothetical protein